MSSYLKDLQEVRDAFLAERRRVAMNAVQTGKANKEGPSLGIAGAIRALQEHIEAIDRAIADEEKESQKATTGTAGSKFAALQRPGSGYE